MALPSKGFCALPSLVEGRSHFLSPRNGACHWSRLRVFVGSTGASLACVRHPPCHTLACKSTRKLLACPWLYVSFRRNGGSAEIGDMLKAGRTWNLIEWGFQRKTRSGNADCDSRLLNYYLQRYHFPWSCVRLGTESHRVKTVDILGYR